MDGTEFARTNSLRAVIELRQRILSGKLPGGTRLYEVALAEELNISRTPVREAMSRLAEEGLLERVQGGGFVVRSFAYADVIDMIELRGVLEGTAARLAAERGPLPDRLAAIQATLTTIDGCFSANGDVDFEGYARLNAVFHEQLAGLVGSTVIEAEIARVVRLPFASPSAFLPDGSRIENFRRTLTSAHIQHHAIVEAIIAREGARAEALAREHTRAARRDVDYIFQRDPRAFPQVAGLSLVSG